MWKDPRTPATVEQIGKFKVTIYDQAAYDASLREYPDDPFRNATKVTNKPLRIEKQKPASRYNWTKKLEQPLKGAI